VKQMLRAGVLAGLCGGVALAAYLLLVGERTINQAVALESASSVQREMFTRASQHAGGALGAILYGVCAGAVLAVLFAAIRHRMVGDDWQRSLHLSAVAFVTLTVVPMIKYPPNPPGVGDPATLDRRTALYLLLLGMSIVATWSAWRLSRTLRARGVRRELAAPAALATYAIVVGTAWYALPSNTDPVPLPAELLWRFRLSSVGGQAVFWAVTGLCLGALLVRRGTSSSTEVAQSRESTHV